MEQFDTAGGRVAVTLRFRILHILRAPVGGLFRHVCDLAAEQAACGHDVGVVCAAIGNALTEARLEALAPALSLGVHRVAMGRDVGLADLMAARAVGRLARSLDVDVLHGHGAKGGAYARLARAPRVGRPHVVYTPHGGSLHYAPGSMTGRLYMQAERMLLARTDAVLFESAYSRERFCLQVGTPPRLSRVVPNGLREPEFIPVKPDEGAADFLFVGELRQLKGVDLFLDALATVSGRRRVTAVIVGDGPEGTAFRRRAMVLGLDGSIEFAGAMPARDAFRRGRMLVMPSRAESLPYVVLEAAAASVPLIASRVGGIPEIVSGSDTPLVPPNDVAALAVALEHALDAPDLAKARAARLRTAVRGRFSVETMTRDVLELYQSVSRQAANKVLMES